MAVTDLPIAEAAMNEDVPFSAAVGMPDPLPLGYHRLRLQRGKQSTECLLVAAPERAYAPPHTEGKTWGGFLPTYAIRRAQLGSRRSRRSGQSHRLGAGLGGGLVGTLPLLAAFLDEPFEPIPYSPASRLFWNEFYLDVDRILADENIRDVPGLAAVRARPRALPHYAAGRLSPGNGTQTAGVARGAAEDSAGRGRGAMNSRRF